MTKHQTVQVIFSNYTTKVVVGRDNPNFSFTNGWFGEICKLQPGDNGRTHWDTFVQQLLIGASLQLISSPMGSSEHLIAASFIAPHALPADEIGKIGKLSPEMVASVTHRLVQVTFTHPNFSETAPTENPPITAVVEYRGGDEKLYQFMLTGDMAVRAWNRTLMLGQEFRETTPSWLNFPRLKPRTIPNQLIPELSGATS